MFSEIPYCFHRLRFGESPHDRYGVRVAFADAECREDGVGGCARRYDEKIGARYGLHDAFTSGQDARWRVADAKRLDVLDKRPEIFVDGNAHIPTAPRERSQLIQVGPNNPPPLP